MYIDLYLFLIMHVLDKTFAINNKLCDYLNKKNVVNMEDQTNAFNVDLHIAAMDLKRKLIPSLLPRGHRGNTQCFMYVL